MEFLTRIAVNLPPDMSDEDKKLLMAKERERSEALADQGIQRRLWRDPAQRGVWALWEVPDATALHDAVSTLALFPYMNFEVFPLAQHLNDPAARS